MVPETYEVLSFLRVKKVLMGYIKSAGTYNTLRDRHKGIKRTQGYVKTSYEQIMSLRTYKVLNGVFNKKFSKAFDGPRDI